MKNYLSVADTAIWLALIVGKCVLCLCIFKKRLFGRLPWFSSYAVATTLKSILLIYTAFWASYSAYYYLFHITGHIESLLALATLIESGRRVLPGLDLPQKGKAAALLATAMAAAFAFAALWPMRYVEKRLDLASCLCIAIAFTFVAAYSRYLGLYWSRLVAGIASNLGLLYLVDGVTKAMMGHYSSNLVLHVRQLSGIASLFAVLVWIVVVLSPWGENVLTETELKKIERVVADTEACLGAIRVNQI